MRIEQLVLERYGIFSDRELEFASTATLHVVLGANEAGKTSALTAIGDLLFGFAGRTDYDFRHDSKMLRIGGRFRHSGGNIVSARRRKGNKHTLLDANDQPIADETLDPLLAGMTRDTFAREFGLTAAALRAGGEELLSIGGRLAETLAASSTSMAGLSELQDRLQKSADDLFTPRRSSSKRPFFVASDRRDQADRELRDATVTPEAFKRAQQAEQEAATRLNALSASHAKSGGLIARWQRALRARAQLARLDHLRSGLNELADLPEVAQQVAEEWRGLLAEKRELEKEIGSIDADDKAAAIELDSLVLDEALISESAMIDLLRDRLGAYRKAVEDLPRRKVARDSAEASLTEAARKLGLSSHLELLQKLPTDPALADARAVINQVRRVAEQLSEAEARYTKAVNELEHCKALDSKFGAAFDIEQIKQRFHALGDVSIMQAQLRRDQLSLATERQGASSAVSVLDPSPGSLEKLRSLQLPEPSIVAKFTSEMEREEAEIIRRRSDIASFERVIAETQRELERLTGDREVLTRADLVVARTVRDQQLQALRSELDSERSIRAAIVEDVTLSSDKIDHITDSLLTDTQRATRKEDAQQRLGSLRMELEAASAALAQQEASKSQLVARWNASWVASGLTPRSPAEMQHWRERFDELVGSAKKCDERQADIELTQAKLKEAKTAVVAFLAIAGRQCDIDLPVDNLYAEAKGRFDELLATWADVRAHEATKTKLRRDLTEADQERKRWANESENLQASWPRTMEGIGLLSHVTPTHAEAALTVWGTVAGPKVSLDRESRAVESITSDLEEFTRDVAELARRVAPELEAAAPEIATDQLTRRLGEARVAHETSGRIQALAVKRASVRSKLLARMAGVSRALEEACDSLRIENVGELVREVERVERRQVLRKELKEIDRLLADIADNRDEATLRSERDGLDLDQLPAEIERERVREKQLLEDIRAATVLHEQKRREVEELGRGRDATLAALRRTEAGTELVSIAEDWLLKSAAALLARRSIERHRSEVQDPMISRASELFTLATDGAFVGLSIAYGDDDQPVLVARRNDGELVYIAGLSEGTRDQLFLSLRLALLERRTAEPMPFIGDDLLTSFDDRRTLAGLRLMAAAGAARQVILFTHHTFVADLARSLQSPSIQVLEL